MKAYQRLLAGILSLGIALGGSACGAARADHLSAGETPETAMVNLAADLKNYAREKRPGFLLVGNGAAGLLEVTRTNPEESVARLIDSLDGFLTESVFYVTDDEGKAEPQDEEMLAYLDAMLAKPCAAGKAVWTLDYLADAKLAARDRELGEARGYVSMTAARTELDTLPDEVPDANIQDITRVPEAKNFIFLLNPEKFSSRAAYLTALRQTAADVLVLDLYYGETPLTTEEVESLQQKPQGGRRLVLAYLSVGEAAEYRPYFDASWRKNPPLWLKAANPDWPGSYKVAYWSDPWRAILYGSPSAYLDQILAAGFDGAFLDVMDAWQYFK